MHSLNPRGNSILDMPTRSAKKEFVPHLFFTVQWALKYFPGGGDKSKSRHSCFGRMTFKVFLGYAFFVKAHSFQINFIATSRSRVGIIS